MISFVLRKEHLAYCVNRKMGMRERWECGGWRPRAASVLQVCARTPSKKAKLD